MIIMTNEEAIKTIELVIAEVEWEYPMDYAVAFEEAIQALKKQIPKHVTVDERMLRAEVNCPVCEAPITENDHYCNACGQALDWEEGE